MMRPPGELRDRFDALSAEQQQKAIELMEKAEGFITQCGGTPDVRKHAWEVALSEALRPFDTLPAIEPERTNSLRAGPPSEASLVATPCSEIEEERVEWLWRGYIPRSSLTLLEGPPKGGKSTVLTNIAARVSAGQGMPDGQDCESAGPVLMLSGEDSPGKVIVPRLRLAGARLEAVRILKALDREERPRQFEIGSKDMARLEGQISEVGAVLVIVDPLSIYMGKADAHREQEVRQTLWHLSEVAERTGCSVLCCRHWKKARTGDALAQGGGSVGFGAAARSILSVERNPDDKASRVLAAGYGNYATEYPSLAFHLESVAGEDVARVVWDGVSRHDADALAGVRLTGADRGALSEAEDFLTELLAPPGRLVPAREVMAGAEAAGISKDTLRRAKESIGAKVQKDGLAGGWNWSLSAGDGHRRSETVSSIRTPFSNRIFEDTERGAL
jgi:hypothetical protein